MATLTRWKRVEFIYITPSIIKRKTYIKIDLQYGPILIIEYIRLQEHVGSQTALVHRNAYYLAA